MNSFINKFLKWARSSSFGLIVTSIALVFVVCVGIIVNQQRIEDVAKPSDNPVVLDSSTIEDSSSSTTHSDLPIIEKVKMPFTVNATIARYFFDSADSIEIKSQALVNYDNKFIPSLGVDYIYENEAFDVISSFKGVVVEKTNDSLYGLTIIVENEEGLRAHYCGLSNVKVFLNQEVSQGQIIGSSGESVINASLGNHLHFALEIEDVYLNPLKTYDKPVDELVN